jgi:hypothetical protein
MLGLLAVDLGADLGAAEVAQRCVAFVPGDEQVAVAVGRTITGVICPSSAIDPASAATSSAATSRTLLSWRMRSSAIICTPAPTSVLVAIRPSSRSVGPRRARGPLPRPPGARQGAIIGGMSAGLEQPGCACSEHR